MAKVKDRVMKFSKLVAHGEGERFTAQTANGTALAGNDKSGWNRQWNWDYGDHQVDRVGAWKNGNRTGE